VKAPRFSYTRATSIEHACALLAEHGPEARILAGGQSLMPTLNMRLSQPRLLVDINRIEALTGIRREGDTIRIGALARHAEVMASPEVARHLPLIAQAMPHVAHLAVRNRGTFGGSIANADPAAEMPACALALEATMVLESVRGRRTVAADAYFTGLYETARAADELLVEVRLPIARADDIHVFDELSRRHGDFAMAGVACRARARAGRLDDIRIVCFGSEEKPTVAQHAMARLQGHAPDAATIDAAAAALGQDLAPMQALESDPAMLLHLQRVLLRRALAKIASHPA